MEQMKEPLLVKSQLEALDKGMGLLNINFSSKQRDQFKSYLELLYLWNKKINLFSQHDSNRLVERHILESVAWTINLEKMINSPVMDIGSGAGFPGIPISILFPNVELVLVESKKKKAIFLEEISHRLGLNITVFPDRIEELNSQVFHKERYPLVLARAVTSLTKLFQWANKLLQKKGKLVTFKGDQLEQEMTDLKRDHLIKNPFSTKIVKYQTPINLINKPEKQERRIIIIQKEN